MAEVQALLKHTLTNSLGKVADPTGFLRSYVVKIIKFIKSYT